MDHLQLVKVSSVTICAYEYIRYVRNSMKTICVDQISGSEVNYVGYITP